MISSTSSADRSLPPSAIQGVSHSASSTSTQRPDRISTQHAAALKAALAGQPEIRPDVVARGRELAADPSYPSARILQHVGKALLQAPDLTEDES